MGWTHVIGVYNGAAGELSLYINGSLVGTTSGVPSSFATDGGVKRIAKSWDNAALFKGTIDEVAIWNRALDSTEIAQLYRRGGNRVKFQIRTCSDSTCTTGASSWLGPDGTSATEFTEVYNTTSNSLPGVVLAALPTMTYSNFGSLSVTSNPYFQYRAILESDDENTLCNYGGGANTANCSPELKSVTVGPFRYTQTAQSVYSNLGVRFADLSTFTETLGSGGCASGIGYNLSLDKTTWKYWNGTAWATANGTVTTSNTAATIQSNIATFGTQVGFGTVYFKAYLQSTGTSKCELNSIHLGGI
jgi:hypothetical protein